MVKTNRRVGMTVVVVGGHDRLKPQLEEYAKENQLKLRFINRWSPQASHTLSSADYIIIITGCVSHELVKLAKSCGKKKCIFCRSKGLCRIKKLITQLRVHA